MANSTQETCKQCSTVGACPFAYNDYSEQAQNYGCLPSGQGIVRMRQNHGKSWACHSNPKKPCLGALNYMREKGLEFKVIDPILLTEQSDWHLYCKKEQTQNGQ